MASASPRRQQLIKIIDKNCICIPSDVEEIVPENIKLKKAPQYLSGLKAKDVAASHKNSLVIGCDTGVFINGEMLGKPTDTKSAYDMLKKLSGNTHSVITGCTIILNDRMRQFSVETKVTFYSLTDKQIYNYIETREPMDKAGAYGIQKYGSLLVKSITGDYFNVVGLPVARLEREIEKFIK